MSIVPKMPLPLCLGNVSIESAEAVSSILHSIEARQGLFQTLDLSHLHDLVVFEDPYPQRMLLLAQLGDETLDMLTTAQVFRRSPAWLQPGGSHRFERFEQTFAAISAFLHHTTC